MTDFRTLCAELVDELEDWVAFGDEADCADAHALVDRARAALAQPEPQGPSKAELRQLFDDQSGYINDEQVMWWADFHKAARAVLARWGRPTIKPVPVAERLPGLEDCDAGGRCWWWIVDEPGEFPHWIYAPLEAQAWAGYSAWLPHHALPMPQQEVAPNVN
jgi:hypothetical protein